MDLGIPFYFSSLLGAFVWLVGSPALSANLSVGELIAGAICIGTLAPAYISYLVACCLSMLEPQTIIITCIIMLYLVVERIPPFLREIQERTSWSKSRRTELLDAAGAWGSVLALAYPAWSLYTTRMIPEDGHGHVFSGGSCWADLPIHMHIVEAFLSGRNADVSWGEMQSPVFAGDKFAYPFIPDWHTAVMVRLGSTMRMGFLIPGFFLFCAFVALLYYLALRVTRSRLAGLFALLLTITSGGMGGINLWARDGYASAAMQDVAQNDVLGEGKVFWFAFIPHIFLPQRGANFAYPLVLFILLLLWTGTDTSSAAGRRAPPAAKGALLLHAAYFSALLPLVQAHAFMATGIVIGLFFLLDAHKWLGDLRLLTGWFKAGLVAGALTIPQMALFRSHAASGAGGKFVQYGWIGNLHDIGNAEGTAFDMIPFGGFLRFWWMSLGPAVPLGFLALIVVLAETIRGMSVITGAVNMGAVAQTLRDLRKEADKAHGYGAGGGQIVSPSSDSSSSSASNGSGSTPTPSKGKKNDDLSADDAATEKSASAAGGGSSSSSSSSSNSSGGGSARKRGGGGAAKNDVDAIASSSGIGSGNSSGSSGSGSLDAAGPWSPALGSESFNASGGSSSISISGDASLLEHVAYILASLLPISLQNIIAGRTSLSIPVLADFFAPGNEATITHRSFDAFKLGLAGFAIFFVGNFINFQPWDRDNTKLLYVWVFINSVLVGGLLAAPIEYIAGVFPGYPRLIAFVASRKDAQDLGQGMESGKLVVSGGLPSLINNAAPSLSVLLTPEGGAPSPQPTSASDSGGPQRPEPSISAASKISFPLSIVGLILIPFVLFYWSTSGVMMLQREFTLYHQLFDQDQLSMGKYIRENTPPKAVFLHRDIHIVPSGSLAGRPTLVGYTGWMWSHGYNYYDRDRDRTSILDSCLKDSDNDSYQALRRWGVRYVLGENLKRHPRSRNAIPPTGDPTANPSDFFLDGQLKRIYTAGRYELLEVQGYGFPPS